jgi:predicted amidohydrolase
VRISAAVLLLSYMTIFPTLVLILSSLGGYPKGLTFGCVVGERDPTGRDDYLAYVKSAVTIPGPAISRVEEIAKEHDVMIVSGAIEKVGGTLYCSVIWVHPEHGLVGKRRKVSSQSALALGMGSKSSDRVYRLRLKLMPTGSERLIWSAGDHTDVKVCRTTLPRNDTDETITLSSIICWENYMPLFRYRMYELGTQIYCAPTVDGRESFFSTMTHIALEGRCFVLAACQMSLISFHSHGII